MNAWLVICEGCLNEVFKSIGTEVVKISLHHCLEKEFYLLKFKALVSEIEDLVKEG